MTDVDEGRRELLERELTERVPARVPPALFGRYTVVGTIGLTLLEFVNRDVVADIRREIKEAVSGALDKEIDDKRKGMSERVIETRRIAERASELVRCVGEPLDASEPQAENPSSTSEQVRRLNAASQELIVLCTAEIKPLIVGVESRSAPLGALARQVDELDHAPATEAAVGSAYALSPPARYSRHRSAERHGPGRGDRQRLSVGARTTACQLG